MTFPCLSRADMTLRNLSKTHGKNKSKGCGAKRKERGQSWTCQLSQGQKQHCLSCRRSPTRLVSAWSGGGTVPTCSSSSEASGAPLKQPEHIKAFRLRAGQMQNGADENLQPHFIRQVIAGTPVPHTNAMCMIPERKFPSHVAPFTGNTGSSTDSAQRTATWRLVASEAVSAPRIASTARSSAVSASIWAVSTERSARILRVEQALWNSAASSRVS